MPRGRLSIFRFFLSDYDRDDPVDRQRMTDLCQDLDAQTRRLGAVPVIAWPRQLLAFSAYPLYRIIKRALEPHDIMRPTPAK